ncbi:MAG: leucyl aminopeptidase family protein [Planctomycetota bacterium]|nr:MAG: leucyl aminopeptidase family protein [Planctomycetota bacterium]
MFDRISIVRAAKAVSILAVFSDDKTLSKTDRNAARDAAVAAASFRADLGETTAASDGTVIVGLGKKAEFKSKEARTAGARCVRGLERMKIAKARLAFGAMFESKDQRELGQCFGEGMAIANWRVDMFDGKSTQRAPRAGTLSIDGGTGVFSEGFARGLEIATSVNEARRIASTPPNICTPNWFAGETKKLAKAAGMVFKLISFAEAKKLGMGGIVAVGQGSAERSLIAILEYKPKRVSAKARGKTLALVGKTLTYDTGGYSLKVNNGMKGTKYDKCGGAAVFGAMHAIAHAKLPIHVVALFPAAENMVSSNAYRPDDIITMYDGTTVEVTNTDAEGRLVLADAISYGCEKYKPTTMIELSTLTGGVVTALGPWSAGYFCDDAPLRDAIESSSARTGEKVWRLPLWKEHKDHMKSQHADIINSNPSRLAHPIQGAAFLDYFVDKSVPFAHIDIAGVANSESPSELCVAGPNGYGVRMLIDIAESMC